VTNCRFAIVGTGGAIMLGGVGASSAPAQGTPPSPAPAPTVDSTGAAAGSRSTSRAADSSGQLATGGGGEAADHIAAGDQERAAMHPDAALAEYERAIALDSSNYEALYKASREAVDLGEFEPNEATRKADFATALGYARRAVTANPAGADGHFAVARVLGRQALSVGGKARIRYAKEVRVEALAALKADSNHAGALHVLGVWNAEVMRLSGLERFIARNLLGGGVLGSANWQEAVRYMERSVAVEPQRIVHHLDLGKIYADIGDTAKAREQFQLVVSAVPAEYNDPHYQQDAQRRLAHL
jgi:tetratricopeptide (TPR) repeat protein